MALLWAIEGFDQLVMSGGTSTTRGPAGLRATGFVGVLLAPFLHGDWGHLAAKLEDRCWCSAS